MKLAPLLFALLLLTACRSHKATTDVATASSITARDTSHHVTTARQTADTAATLCILSVDSLTLSRVAADVVPDSVVLRAIAEHAAATERSDSPVLPAAAVHTLRVYGLRLAVSTAAARRTTADSVAAATKTDVTEQVATHVTTKTITPAAPRLTTPLLLLFVIAALLLAAAYWWKRKQAANN